MHARRVTIVAFASLITTSLFAATLVGGGSSSEITSAAARTEPAVAVRGPIVGTVPMVDYDEQQAIQVDYYLTVIVPEQRAVAAYLAAVEAQRLADEAAAAAAAAARARATSSSTVARGGTTVGACTGFSIPDYIIQRESGGNPNAMNPSGAYGCAQTLLSHYNAGGACSGDDPYTIDGQRDCVNRLSSGGTNLAPWAQTR